MRLLYGASLSSSSLGRIRFERKTMVFSFKKKTQIAVTQIFIFMNLKFVCALNALCQNNGFLTFPFFDKKKVYDLKKHRVYDCLATINTIKCLKVSLHISAFQNHSINYFSQNKTYIFLADIFFHINLVDILT